MEKQESERGQLKTPKTAFRIIEAIERLDGAGVTELAIDLDLAKSTIHRHLSTLEDIEYLVCEGDTYYVSLKFLQLGEYSRNRKNAYSLARPKLRELAEETGERAQFIVEEHGLAVYVHRKSGPRAVETDSGIGKRVALHATAAGKAILAHMDDERVNTIIKDRGLPALTAYTITERSSLFEELDTVRERGFSVNDQESTDGLRAIGVPVRGSDDDIIGALSVSGPTHRIKGEIYEQTIPRLLLGTANELELNIAYS